MNIERGYNYELVSVIIPTYKRCDYLKNAIESVLNQTYRNIEVIVVSDNDKEDEYSTMLKCMIEGLSDTRVRLIEQDKHTNGAVARNIGIRDSKGKYIAFLDDDDEWRADKLEKQIDYLEKHKDLGGVSCLYVYYNKNVPVRKCNVYSTCNLHEKVLSRAVEVSTPTLLLKKDCLDKAGLFDETLMRHQELQLLLDFLALYKIELVPFYMVRVNCDSTLNRPNVARMIEIKKVFFEREEKHFNQYSLKKRKRIKCAHYFELVHVSVKSRDFKTAFKYWLKIGINVGAYYDILNRCKERFLSRLHIDEAVLSDYHKDNEFH